MPTIPHHHPAGLAGFLLLLTGCMSMAPLPSDGGGVKSSGAICSTFTGLAGVRAKVVQVTSDSGVVKNGTVRSSGDCEVVEFTTNQSPPKVTTTTTVTTTPP
jgi:hypothetical protein